MVIKMNQERKVKKNIFSRVTSRLTSLPMAFWIIAAVILTILELVRRFAFGGGCLLKDIFGVPCPSCGMSRAFYCVLRLDFSMAFYYNPAFWVIPLLCVTGAAAIADKKRRKLWAALFGALILVIVAVWIYRLVTGTAV